MAASLGPKKGRNNLRRVFCLFHLFNPKLLRKTHGEPLKLHKTSERLTWRQALGLLLLPPWHFPPFLITFSSLFRDKEKKGFSHWDWRRQWWQGLGRAPGFARFKVYCWGNGNTQAEEVPLLLLPCLDYGCSRCKCVSEPLTNTNAGIKGQQQQSRQTRARTHTHTYTDARSLSRSHRRSHARSLSLSHTHSLTHSNAHLRARTHWRSSPPRAAYGQGAPKLSECITEQKIYLRKQGHNSAERAYWWSRVALKGVRAISFPQKQNKQKNHYK